MIEGLVCWKCGASLDEVPQPFARLAECLSCRTELHVCRMCEFYDPRVSQSCREPMADAVGNKERANFCAYFQPRPGAAPVQDSGDAGARAKLDALFGGSGERSGGESDTDELDALKKLFQTKPGQE